jgi:predicted transcriptional regulator
MFNIYEHSMSLKELQSLLNMPELGADDLLKCALGAKSMEIEVYCTLANMGPMTVQEAAEKIGKSRSTMQRILQGLVEKGIATREERLIGLGGYKYLYQAVPPKKLKELVLKMLDKWYRRMLEELEDLPEKVEIIGCTRVS